MGLQFLAQDFMIFSPSVALGFDFDGSAFPSGTYLVRVQRGNEVVQTSEIGEITIQATSPF